MTCCAWLHWQIFVNYLCCDTAFCHGLTHELLFSPLGSTVKESPSFQLLQSQCFNKNKPTISSPLFMLVLFLKIFITYICFLKIHFKAFKKSKDLKFNKYISAIKTQDFLYIKQKGKMVLLCWFIVIKENHIIIGKQSRNHWKHIIVLEWGITTPFLVTVEHCNISDSQM